MASCLAIWRPTTDCPSPAAPDAAIAATTWVVENGALIETDSARLAVAGDSAGGNLTSVVALEARHVRRAGTATSAVNEITVGPYCRQPVEGEAAPRRPSKARWAPTRSPSTPTSPPAGVGQEPGIYGTVVPTSAPDTLEVFLHISKTEFEDAGFSIAVFC